MEIVLATNGLIGIGGSETYLLTVAEHLQRLGHEVTVHATEGGAMSALITVIEEGVFCGPRLIVTNDPEMGRQGPGVVHPVTTLRRGCRIAANVTLLPGVEIGEEAVVGASSLVTRSVPPRTVVVGAPARVLREVRDDERAR
jgi:acetyltransferase-like isoleucine patch superfamily enzyme